MINSPPATFPLAGAQAVSERRAREAAAADAAEVAAGGGMSRRDCWPASWLAGDLRGARLLSLEYAAPASGWEVPPPPLWPADPALDHRSPP